MARKKAPSRGKNLIRTDDYITNQFGVKISQDEVKRMQSLVRRVNYKRNKMIKEFADKPLYYGGKKLDEDRRQLSLMGEEMDIMIRKRSAAVNQFGSKKEFNAYVRQLERVADTDYMEYRSRLYKRNLMKAIEEKYANFPDQTKGILMKIRMMKPEEFQKLIGTDRLFQIKEHYMLGGALNRLANMRERLGLRPLDLEDDEEEI